MSVYSTESPSFIDTCYSETRTAMHMHTRATTGTHNPLLLVFFFFLGLIIDAFGELRDQQEQVKEDMEVRFDTVSHIHTHTNTPPDIYHPNYMSIFCVLSRLYNVQRCFRLKL